MTIYGDGKHNENMEYNASKYVVTDKTVYHTTNWRVETENDTYLVQCQENDFDETWYIESEEDGPIDTGTKLGHKLIDICESWKPIEHPKFTDKPFIENDYTTYEDEEWDMDGGYGG